ncbi:hypothetical protein [Devosia faecipullorum]|uniref:hypothetical protein n=1 Tax=Devosia faecipullorum TaxID=2755039 RepID=UPI00187B2486|nr:hypothetical protein [Devosia faecipullorum]MBE7731513.1 hypothetical protein [Devosia faecipullorum]
MRLGLFLGSVALLGTNVPVLAQDCAEWGQDIELTGIVVEGLYPGPPEFESVAGGDAAIDTLMLHLETPICVNGSDELETDALDFSELVQLACDYKQITKFPRGEWINVSGRLFSAHTAYHVTPALLQCD